MGQLRSDSNSIESPADRKKNSSLKWSWPADKVRAENGQVSLRLLSCTRYHFLTYSSWTWFPESYLSSYEDVQFICTCERKLISSVLAQYQERKIGISLILDTPFYQGRSDHYNLKDKSKFIAKRPVQAERMFFVAADISDPPRVQLFIQGEFQSSPTHWWVSVPAGNKRHIQMGWLRRVDKRKWLWQCGQSEDIQRGMEKHPRVSLKQQLKQQFWKLEASWGPCNLFRGPQGQN